MGSHGKANRPAQLLITGLAVWATLAGVAEGTDYFSGGLADLPIPAWSVGSQYLIAALSCALSLILAWSLPGRPDAEALALHLGLLALAHALLVDGSGSPGPLHRGTFAVSGAGALAAFVGFTRIFPAFDPEGAGRERWPYVREPLAAWSWALALPYAGLLFLTYSRYGDEFGMMLVERYSPGARVGVALVALGFVAGVSVGVGSLLRRHRVAERSDQKRILLILAAYLLSFAVLLILASLVTLAIATGNRFLIVSSTWAGYILWPVAVVTVLLALFVAVFFTTVFDPSGAIRRTAVYGSLVVVLTFAFAGIEELVTAAATDRLGLPDAVGTWIAGGTVALAVSPLHGFLDRRIRSQLHDRGLDVEA